MILLIEYYDQYEFGMDDTLNINQYLGDIFFELCQTQPDIIKKISKLFILVPPFKNTSVDKIKKVSFNEFVSFEETLLIEPLVKELMKNAEYILYEKDGENFKGISQKLNKEDLLFWSDNLITPNVIKILATLPNVKGYISSKEYINEIEDLESFFNLAKIRFAIDEFQSDFESTIQKLNEYEKYYKYKSLCELFAHYSIQEKFNSKQFIYMWSEDSYVRKIFLQELVQDLKRLYLNSEADLPNEFPNFYDSIIIDDIDKFHQMEQNILHSLIIDWLKRKKNGKVIFCGKYIKLIQPLEIKFKKIELLSQQIIKEKIDYLLTLIFVQNQVIELWHSNTMLSVLADLPDKISGKQISLENIENFIIKAKDQYFPNYNLLCTITEMYEFKRDLIRALTQIKKEVPLEKRIIKKKIIFNHSKPLAKQWTIKGIAGLESLPYNTNIAMRYLVCIIQNYKLNNKFISVSDLVTLVIRYKNKPNCRKDLTRRILDENIDKISDLKAIQVAFSGKKENPIDPNLKNFIKKHIKKKNYKYSFIPIDEDETELVECDIYDPLLNMEWFEIDSRKKLRESLKSRTPL